ncbi:unnamed protein product, partial [Prorocentrum cordatum]
PLWSNHTGSRCRRGRLVRPAAVLSAAGACAGRAMAARSKLGSLRATLAEEQSRLSRVLDQIDEALDCLEPEAQREGAGPEKAASSPALHESYHLASKHAICVDEALDCLEPDGQKEGAGVERTASSPGLHEGQHPTVREAALAGRRVVPQGSGSHVPVSAWGSTARGRSPRASPRASLEQLACEGPPPTAQPLRPRPPGTTAPKSALRRAASDLAGLAPGAAWGSRRKQSTRRTERQVFANADQMKLQVQKMILEPDYDVRNYYKEEGCSQAIARSWLFDSASLVVILANAVWLAVETDYNDETLLVNADAPFIVVENFFCTFFFVELLVRFLAFRAKADVVKDSWFIFDSIIVACMVFETCSSSTSVLRVVRLFRMTRAARVARLLKAVPELMVIGSRQTVLGLPTAPRRGAVGAPWRVYMFAIVFTQLAKGTDLERSICSDMLTTMSTLLLGGILPDFKPTTEDMAAEDIFFAAFFFIFVLLAYVVSVVASVEKETNQVAAVKRVLEKWAPEADTNGDCIFDVNEFKTMLNKDGCAKELKEVGVDPIALIDHADWIYRNKDALTFSELLSVVLGLRGRNDAKVQDLVQMRKFLHTEMQRIEGSLENLHRNLNQNFVTPLVG